MSITGVRKGSIVDENLLATSANLENKRKMARHKKMCWSCQCEKATTGGSMWTMPGFQKFVCFDCLEKKRITKVTT